MLLILGLGLNGLLNAQTIVSYRYWFDNNFANATTVSVTAAQNINLSASLSTNTLGNGYHTITTQFTDANGAYSSPITNSFVKTGFNIDAYDYWWDSNYANHTVVNVNAAQNINLSTAIVPSGLDTGIHYFAIRFKDLQGNWSVPIQDTVDITVVAGIQELTSVNNVALSPNPTHASSVLRFEGAGDEVLTMSMTDATGNEVSHQQLQNGYAVQQYEIKTTELAAGLYFVKLTSSKGQSTRKLVVQ